MRTRRAVAAIWLCFLLRSAFYAAMLPLWEGYDEWGHFSVASIMAFRGRMFVARDAPVPRDVGASLDLAPVPYALAGYPPPAITQDAFWKLPEAERSRREAEFRAIPLAWRYQDSTGALTAYEAHHPPLYYWLMAPVLRMMGGASLAAQIMTLRWLACLLASLAIPLLFLTGREVFRDDALALGCAAVIAVMPEFAIDVARVSNECVSVPLFTLLIYAALKIAREGLSYRYAWMAGAALGFGLLSKAYFLTAVPVLAVIYVYALRRAKDHRAPRPSWGGQSCPRTGILAGPPAVRPAWGPAADEGVRPTQTRLRRSDSLGPLLCGTLLPIVLAGWWQFRNVLTSGTVSGMSEAAATRSVPFSRMLLAAVRIDWFKVADGILLSHIYFGAWSSLTIRAWMYHLFYAIVAAAAVGLALRVRNSALAWAAAFYFLFLAGQLYQAVMLSLSTGVAAAMGWHTYAVAGAETALGIAGLRAVLPSRARKWVIPAGVALFSLLDLYTVHAIAIPYYTGIVAHKANGGVAAVHLADLPKYAGAFGRLAAFKSGIAPPAAIACLWLAYLAATFWLVVAAFRRARS